MKKSLNNQAKSMESRFILTENPKTPTENLRKELREAFPTVKFSVRYKAFLGGDGIVVSYNDGPTAEAVEAIAMRYAWDSSDCDVMTDYYDYHPTEFVKKYGGAKFVLIQREMSDGAREQFCAKAVDLLPELADGRKMRRDDLFEPGKACRSVELFEATRGLYWVCAESLARVLFSKVSIA